MIPAIVAVLVVALAGVGAFFVFGGDEASAEVVAESVTDPGADPFMSSMAVVEVAEFPSDVTAVIDATREGLSSQDGILLASGTTPGLYGGSNDEAVCDAGTLVAFLEDHPDEATAWASVQGIGPDGIADYVAGLTSVVLTTDTLVVNHGFANGQATPRDAVLQAGTAVMVDDTGVPRVKCGCGNPLLPPNSGSVDLGNVTGAWDGFDAGQVAVVDPGQTAESLEVVDVETGDTITQPIGSSAVIVLRSDGLGVASFGDDMDTVVATLTDILGPPEVDAVEGSGNFRNVQWPGFRISDGGVGPQSTGLEGFQSYFVSGPELAAATSEGISVGSAASEVFAAYDRLFDGYAGCTPAAETSATVRTAEGIVFRLAGGAVTDIDVNIRQEFC